MRRRVVVLAAACGLVVFAALVVVVVTGVGPSLPGPPVREMLGLSQPVGACTPDLDEVRSLGRSPADAGRWEPATALPVELDEVRATPAGEAIFVGTGLEARDGTLRSVGTVYRFNPVNGSFDVVGTTPQRVDHPAFIFEDDYLYVLGGFHDGEATRNAWRWSTVDRRWERLPPLPRPRGAPAAAAVDGRIYVVGGTEGNNLEGNPAPTRDVFVYDLERASWSRAAPMPTPRHHHDAVTIDGVVYVAGGRSLEDLSLDAFERYDADADAWTRLPPLPLGVGGTSAVRLDGSIVVLGGGDDAERWITPNVWSFDARSGTWRRLADLGTPRHGHGAASDGDSVYVFGGAPCVGYGKTSSVERYVG